MPHRREQLESSLRREIGRLLTEGLADPRIGGIISVTGVRVSEDRRHAAVSVSVLPAERARTTLHGLRHAAGHIQNLIGRRLRTRAMPHLDFRLDESLKRQAEVLGAIREVMDEGPAPSTDPAAADTDAPDGVKKKEETRR